MNKESHQMKKRLEAFKEKGGELTSNEEEKKTPDSQATSKKKTLNYKNLWPQSEEKK